jgi:hypothetical protein
MQANKALGNFIKSLLKPFPDLIGGDWDWWRIPVIAATVRSDLVDILRQET